MPGNVIGGTPPLTLGRGSLQSYVSDWAEAASYYSALESSIHDGLGGSCHVTGKSPDIRETGVQIPAPLLISETLHKQATVPLRASVFPSEKWQLERLPLGLPWAKEKEATEEGRNTVKCLAQRYWRPEISMSFFPSSGTLPERGKREVTEGWGALQRKRRLPTVQAVHPGDTALRSRASSDAF